MKRIFLMFLLSMLLYGCGVGSYSMSSGRADEGGISFVDDKEYGIEVVVDGKSYSVNTVKTKAYKRDRKIKQTVNNTIVVGTGSHKVEVKFSGNTVYSKSVFISAGENKVIEL